MSELIGLGLFKRYPHCGRRKWPWSSVLIVQGQVVHRLCGLEMQAFPKNNSQNGNERG